MVTIRPLINVLGKIVGLPSDSYLDPTSLGNGTPDVNKWLRGDGVTFFCVVSMSSGDYLEIHCANTSVATDITVEQMNFTVTGIR